MQPTHRIAMVGTVAAVLTLTACADESTPTAPAALSPTSAAVVRNDDAEAVGYSEALSELNRQLAASSRNVAVARAELLVSENAAAQSPRIILANDRTKALSSKWVPRDIRRLSTSADLSYVVFKPLAAAPVGGNAELAIDQAAATWNSASCSNLRVNKAPYAGQLPPSFLLTGGVFPPADINHVGFVPPAVIDQAFGKVGASANVIGVTFTFTFIVVGPNGPVLDPSGNPIPTDVDGDGRQDTAFKEIWFNNALAYSQSGTPGFIDIETAVLHEHGHAIERSHFGKIAGNLKTLKLQVSPRAVMNAAYVGPIRQLAGTDVAGLCGDFANWR